MATKQEKVLGLIPNYRNVNLYYRAVFLIGRNGYIPLPPAIEQ